MTEPVRVFVYGALMDGIEGRAAVAHDMAVRFTARGLPWLEPRFLALEPDPGGTAHGVVAELAPDEWRRSIAHESGYDAREVVIEVDGERLTATALVLQDRERVSEGVPSRRYAERLVRGATANGLPPHVIERYRTAAREGSAVTVWLVPIVAPIRRLTGVFGLYVAVVLVGALLAQILWWLWSFGRG